jgi:hypothetical protein
MSNMGKYKLQGWVQMRVTNYRENNGSCALFLMNSSFP